MEIADLDTGRKLPIKQLLSEQALNLSTHFDFEKRIGMVGYLLGPASFRRMALHFSFYFKSQREFVKIMTLLLFM